MLTSTRMRTSRTDLLVITDAIRGTLRAIGQPPQLWNTFTEQTPNSLFFGTDPITQRLWARMINDERQTHAGPPSRVHGSSKAPALPTVWESAPGADDVLRYEASDVEEPSGSIGDTTFFAPNVPNPSRVDDHPFRMVGPVRRRCRSWPPTPDDSGS